MRRFVNTYHMKTLVALLSDIKIILNSDDYLRSSNILFRLMCMYFNDHIENLNLKQELKIFYY